MTRGWANGFLAVLFIVTLIQGNLLPRSMTLSFAVALAAGPLSFIQLDGSQPAARFSEKGIEPATSRPSGQTKRDREGGGDEPTLLPSLLVVAIALFYALPLRGSDVVRALRIGLTPEGRYREAGRCPTGPPGIAC